MIEDERSGESRVRCPPRPIRLAVRISLFETIGARVVIYSLIVTSTRTRANHPKTGIFGQVHTKNPL